MNYLWFFSFFLEPSSPPKITSVTTPSPTVITVIWKPPLFPNSQLLGYKLMVVDTKRQVLREVSPSTLSWTFNQLQPLHTYTIKVSAWNSGGEGPADMLQITTPEPIPGKILEMSFTIVFENFLKNENFLYLIWRPKEYIFF